MNTKSYTREIDNDNVHWNAYEKDFSNFGDFEIEEEHEETCLTCSIYPGMLDPKTKKWNESADTDDDSYFMYFVYRSKNCIEIDFQSQYGGGIHLKPSFDFVKEIAKNHYLVNECVKKAIDDKLQIDCNSFDGVEMIINHYQSDPCYSPYLGNEKLKYRDCQSWSKTMTLEEAKQLMADLAIEIKFPS